MMDSVLANLRDLNDATRHADVLYRDKYHEKISEDDQADIQKALFLIKNLLL